MFGLLFPEEWNFKAPKAPSAPRVSDLTLGVAEVLRIQRLGPGAEPTTRCLAALSPWSPPWHRGAQLLLFPQKTQAMTGAYGGMTSETGGVVSLLETISADFARLEADTKSEDTRNAGSPEGAGCKRQSDRWSCTSTLMIVMMVMMVMIVM